MSERWPVAPLGGHCSVKARIGWRGLASSEYVADGPFLIAGKHVRDGVISWDACDHISEHRYRESMEIALEPGDVILTKDGTIGRVARVDTLPGAATLNGTMMLLRPREGLDYRYLFHVLRGKHFKQLIDDKVSGSSIPHIFQRDMVTLPIALPPPEQQQAIANVLDTLDTTIRLTEAIIEKLKQIKQGLLHDLLTRGIGANGELRPPRNQAPHLYKDSPLGWIPREWRSEALRNALAGIDGGWSPDCVEVTPPAGQWGVLKLSAITSGRYVPSESKTLPDSLRPDPSVEVHVGDVLLARANGVAELVAITVFVDATPDRLMLSDKTLRLRPVDGTLSARFLTILMAFDLTRRQIRGMLNGSSGQQNISQRQIGNLVVALPPFTEQRAIEARLISVEDRHFAEVRVVEKLRREKSGLMDDLLSGRVRVTPLLNATP